MGQRSRRAGIAGRALRAARAAAVQQDEEAAKIAQRVYGVAVAMKPAQRIPLSILAPVLTGAEIAAGIVAKANGLPLEEEEVSYVAEYLLNGFEAMIVEFNVEHYTEWKAKAHERLG